MAPAPLVDGAKVGVRGGGGKRGGKSGGAGERSKSTEPAGAVKHPTHLEQPAYNARSQRLLRSSAKPRNRSYACAASLHLHGGSGFRFLPRGRRRSVSMESAPGAGGKGVVLFPASGLGIVNVPAPIRTFGFPRQRSGDVGATLLPLRWFRPLRSVWLGSTRCGEHSPRMVGSPPQSVAPPPPNGRSRSRNMACAPFRPALRVALCPDAFAGYFLSLLPFSCQSFRYFPDTEHVLLEYADESHGRGLGLVPENPRERIGQVASASVSTSCTKVLRFP